MADQCIVCLEELDSIPAIHDPLTVAAADTIPSTTLPSTTEKQQPIAQIKPCGHVLHDECLREWSQKANSCPICRQNFNLVDVLDKVGGSVQSEYIVENRKQVAEFDPNAWIEEELEEEEECDPCPICGKSDDEDVLLLCDECNAPYHTHCIGLDRVPRGDWFCMECAENGAYIRSNEPMSRPTNSGRDGPRTYASIRRARQRVRNDPWTGAWNQFSGRVLDIVGLDLDFIDDDQSMVPYRRHQRHTEDQRREFQRWQTRLTIASRQGARNVFREAAPQRIREHLPQTPRETVEETRAWGAFEKAKEIDTASPGSSRKRKSRSVTASPAERDAPKEPERRLKRPRTRRVVDKPGSSSTSATAAAVPVPSRQAQRPMLGEAGPSHQVDSNAPSFLSSLLREVEMAPTSDDDTSRSAFSSTSYPNQVTSPSVEYSSPATSPSPSSSNYPTPRAMSNTPPPHIHKRPGSPLPLTSRVEPVFPPADYSPNRSPPENPHSYEASGGSLIELRQPRPRRRRSVVLPRTQDSSPVRAKMSIEAKESINKIVKTALAPHWKSCEITKEQYENINRDVSRKLYEIADPKSADKSFWEEIATKEVTKAVEGLST